MPESSHEGLRWLLDGLVAVLLHLLHSTAVTLVVLFILFGPLLLAALFSHVISRRVEYRTVQLAGVNGYIYVLGWLGTPVHELGHALMCVIFRHRIEEMQLFRPNKRTGTLGFVRHSFEATSIYQQVGNFFIALGPIILGGLVLYLISLLLVGNAFRAGFSGLPEITELAEIPGAVLNWLLHVLGTLKRLFMGLTYGDWRTWLFLYLVLAIGSHVNLSAADVLAARYGFLIITAVLFVAITFLLLFTSVPVHVFFVPGRLVGFVSSIILACTGIMMPVWILLESLGRLMKTR